MTPDRSEQLYRAFPLLFRRRLLGVHASCMSWGICCGDGWFDIVRNLATSISAVAEREGLQGEEVPAFEQVKEKLGALRVYIRRGDSGHLANSPDSQMWTEIHNLIRVAEELSRGTSEYQEDTRQQNTQDKENQES